MEKSKKGLGRTTALIIVGVLLSYIMQVSPSPVLQSVRELYGIEKESLLNLAVSIVFLGIILSSLAGISLGKRIGTKNLYTCTLIFLAIGMALSLVAARFWILLSGRFIAGVGMGLGIPFIGSAIMQLYDQKGRDTMNTINGLFPFVGTVISFSLMEPLRQLLGGSVRTSLGIWCIPTALVCLFWKLSGDGLFPEEGDGEETAGGLRLYRELLGKKPIRLLCLIFMCDFFCYSYLSVVLPTLFHRLGGGIISESAVNLLAAVAFPCVGIIGCTLGGIAANKTGKRKQVIAIGQALKLLGVGVMALGPKDLVTALLGTALFGFGNGAWMPSMYSIPMECDGMDAAKVGAAFAFVSACGFLCGFLSPILGGAVCDRISAASDYITGIRSSLLLFNAANLLSLICACMLPKDQL